MEIFISMLDTKVQALLNFITSCFMIVICLVIIWYGADLTLEFYHRGVIAHESLETPKFLLIGIIPIGMFLLVIQSTRRMLGHWGRWKEIRNEDSKS
ncbi:TRAP transporter small permease, partial [Chloroflexota bacterium]